MESINVSNNSLPELFINGYYTPLGREVIYTFLHKVTYVNKDWRFSPFQRLQYALKILLKVGYSLNHIKLTIIDVVNSFKGLYIDNNTLKNGKSLALLPVYRHFLTFKQYINLVKKYGKDDIINKFIRYLDGFMPNKLVEEINIINPVNNILLSIFSMKSNPKMSYLKIRTNIIKI